MSPRAGSERAEGPDGARAAAHEGPRTRALIVDDEPLARQALRELLADVPWIECIGEAADGIEAIAALRAERPDLVFLDVQMPGASGVEVLEKAGENVTVIFTTAHDEYAMTAFELGAIDYLRKPFGRDRFLRALERARPHLRGASAGVIAPVASLGERLAFAGSETRQLARIFVRDRGSIIPVKTSDVLHFEADGDYVAVHTAGKRYLVYVNLGDLAARLDASRFVRVHRSHVINLDRVAAIVPHDASRLEVRLQDGTKIVASRAGTGVLRSVLEL